MDTRREQIDAFLKKCDEVMQSKFIIADTKIGELLQCIVSSDLLYAFFREVTKNFDYDAAREKYMNYTPAGGTHMQLLFPEDPAERLAFVFCLLADFDSGAIDLGQFLRTYFYDDGSVYGSFYAFSNQVIKPFRNAVRTVFAEGAAQSAPRTDPCGGNERYRIRALFMRSGCDIDRHPTSETVPYKYYITEGIFVKQGESKSGIIRKSPFGRRHIRTSERRKRKRKTRAPPCGKICHRTAERVHAASPSVEKDKRHSAADTHIRFRFYAVYIFFDTDLRIITYADASP